MQTIQRSIEFEESTLTVFAEELYHELERLSVAGQGMLLAVSGGSDSIAMLHAVARLRERLKLSQLEVAHLNHGLRGTASDHDAEFVRRTCEDYQLVCHVEVIASGELHQVARGSLEEAARHVRYTFLQRVASLRGLSKIATAHHLQDQYETVLFNLLRGTGLRGLRGIPRVRQISQHAQLIRPMLSISRESIQRWLNDQRLTFCVDASNDQMDFARNRIRRLLSELPVPLDEELTQRLAALSVQADATLRSLDAAADVILRGNVLEASESIIRLRRNSLLEWPEPLVRHALTSIWSTSGWPQQQMNRDHWLRLSHIIREGTPRRCSFPSAIELQIRRDVAVLIRPNAESR